MIVCLDTNVLVQARSKRHPWFVLLRSLAFGRMSWAVSNGVITEYEEIILAKCGAVAWQDKARFIDLIAVSGNLVCLQPHYQFRVISADPDDNAFTDCAIAAHADYLITEDRHFAPLANAGYKPQPITPEEFIERYRGVYV